MNPKQAVFTVVCVVVALVLPWFSASMFAMGLAVGSVLCALLSE